MLNYKLKIGLVPERRYLAGPKRTGIFNPDYAVENKNKAIQYIKEHFSDTNTEFIDLEFLNDKGLLFLNSDCEKVVKYFKEQEVDAIFILNCNFGNEEAVGIIAKMMKKPVLLWGPRDTVFDEDGTRYTDSQCGLFAISNQFKRNHIPFSYIENCHLEDEVFTNGVKRFLAVVCMVKNFYGMKITQIGTRVKPFKSVMFNETELTEKFGIDVTPINMTEATVKLNKIYSEKYKELKMLAQEIKAKYDTSSVDEELLIKMMTFVYFYQEIDEETGSNVISTECWTSMQLAFGAMPCLAMSILADMGYIISCESDIQGAITLALLSCAVRGEKPPFFGEFTCRNPKNDNAELLWHCGPFAHSLKDKNKNAYLYNARPSFKVADGDYTISRFQGEQGKYYLLGGNIKSTTGPHTFGTYLWAEFDNLPKVERKLIEGAYIHHMSEVSGHIQDVLKEFCNYVPELIFDDINS